MRRMCSPSMRPGRMKRPSQRSSCSGCAASTVGLKVIGLAFGGSMRTSRVEPTLKSPASLVMNGFHSGYAPVSVRIDQTAAGEASISIDRSIVLDIFGSFELTRLTVLTIIANTVSLSSNESSTRSSNDQSDDNIDRSKVHAPPLCLRDAGRPAVHNDRFRSFTHGTGYWQIAGIPRRPRPRDRLRIESP